ncbi:DNA polymerase subunit Cdc27 [Cubamyces lactineus]|nr:DNA polymerase subunit Cdc27 [Cubamyces lactineus]
MPAMDDYITKQIYIEKNVVTYRSLSRQFSLHVNDAKTELAKFHKQSADKTTRSFATYLVSGEVFPVQGPSQGVSTTQSQDDMDIDSEAVDGGEEDVPTITLTLVGEKDLEDAKAKYARIFSVHVYSLSPSPLTDAGLICDPSVIVHKTDAKDPTSSIALGRVVGPDVKIGKPLPPVASSSKAAEPMSRKPTLNVKTEGAAKSEEATPMKSASLSASSSEKDKTSSSRLKASGKLDWSKAKKPSDSDKGKKDLKVKKEESVSPIENAAKRTAKLDLNDDTTKNGKRGIKRKAEVPEASGVEEKPKSREKERSTPTTTASDIKLRKNRIVSDDEDEEPSPAPRKANGKGKGRASAVADVLESEAEKSLRAMMDIDDALVEKASASRPAPAKPEPVDDEDVEMAQEPEPEPEPEEMEEDKPKPKPRKKKEKKVIPVGRNGLKKKRVMKSRMTVDAKGYMVTEDYSSYESVDEEEAEEEPPKKGRGKKATPTTTSSAKAKKSPGDDAEASGDEAPAKSKSISRASSATKAKKPAAGKAGAQGSLKDFFGKPKK